MPLLRVAPLVAAVSALASAAEPAATAPPTVAAWWEPPGAPSGAARAAFTRVLEERGARAVALPAEEAPPTVLGPRLDEAIASLRAFRFAEAADALTALAQAAAATGGADLDGRRLAELHLSRGLARLELGQATPAWEDLVRAAQLDPGRALDPAQYAPKVVASFRRALADAAQAPRGELEVRAPDGAAVRVDGAAATGPTELGLGTHLVRVEAPGFEPWGGVVALASAHQRFEPPLRPRAPPDGDALAAAARSAGASRIVLGAAVRGASGWRFVARRIDLRDGTGATEEAPLDGDAAATVRRVVGRVLDGPLVAAVAGAKVEKPPPRRWWILGVAAGVAVSVAVAVPLAVTYGPSPGGTVGGMLGPLQ